MGNFCQTADDSGSYSSDDEHIAPSNVREKPKERYPGVHYHEEQRNREGYFRGKQEPECTCFGPTPDERVFIQRCPHNQVLNTTISKDLAELTEEAKVKTQELRQERIRLIRGKVGEITGKELDLDYGSLDDADELAADEQVAQLFEADRVEGKNGNLQVDSGFQLAPTPVPVSDLAPMPSNEEIFGKIDELRKKHAAEMADFEKAQTVNRTRTKQGLEEKLEIRRSRRSRLQAHESELHDIQMSR